jgi:hypothetical protein
MTRAQLLTGTLLDGASPQASVGRCDMLDLQPFDPAGWVWPKLDPGKVIMDELLGWTRDDQGDVVRIPCPPL